MKQDIKRRTAVISGGCGTVGRAVGKALSQQGFDVVALYLKKSKEEAESALHDFSAGDHEAIRCDIRDDEAVRTIIGGIYKRRHSIDAAIHAAVDPILRKGILEISGKEFQDQFGGGVWGGFYFLTECAKVMEVQKGGNIIGILSRVVQSEAPHPRMGGYTVAKYALRGLLKELHQDLASSNVTVNAVAPDFMDTDLHKDLPGAVRKFIAERGVEGGVRSPEDVAAATAYLCSEEGRMVNGKIFSFRESEITIL